MTSHEENARLAKALHEALPAAAIERLCAHIANKLESTWSVPIHPSEVDLAIWEWVRLSRDAARRNETFEMLEQRSNDYDRSRDHE